MVSLNRVYGVVFFATLQHPSQKSGSGFRVPLKRDYMSNLKILMYASRRALAKKSVFRAYTIVCEHFESNRNTAMST
jgi:hypothetical protein